MRLAFSPMGIAPNGSCGAVHVSPKDAVRAAQALEAASPVPMHYAPSNLGDDGQDEPLNVLRQELVHAPA